MTINLIKKSLEEHIEYVIQLSKLSFFFAMYLHQANKKIPTKEFLSKNTPLFKHALEYNCETLSNNSDYLRICLKSDEFENLSLSNFEKKMYDEFGDIIIRRAIITYTRSVGIFIPRSWNAGSLKYDSPVNWLPSNYCNFHIANAIAPKSIFDDFKYLIECFGELMNQSEKIYNYDTLHTCSWLNDNPRWLKLFPEQWHNNLSERSDYVGADFGFWGQLVTARGTFNKTAGEYLRKNGVLKFKCRYSHCSFSAMRKHLLKLINL
jgi:hypothetical protein